MDVRTTRMPTAIRRAFALSLAVHAAALLLRFAPPAALPRTATQEPGVPLDVTLSRPHAVEASPPQIAKLTPPEPPRPPARAANRPDRGPKPITALPRPEAPHVVTPQTPDEAESREYTRKFLEDIAPLPGQQPAAPPPLEQRALATARGIARAEAVAARDAQRAQTNQPIDPLSIELYFEAFVRKLNRSAAFVERDRKADKGDDLAVVQVNLNADGTLKSYKVLRAGDQLAEIAFVKRVVERASPFAAFPPDIRGSADTLSIDICILPSRPGLGGGVFSRTFGGRDCRELG